MTLVTRPAMIDDDGTFTVGTEVDEAFIDAVLDEIDDQAHSTTNPTVKPNAVTDEVVAARGSKASLDARLDVVLNDDGTLKTQASLVTVANIQAGLGSRNVAVNGDLDDWTNGGALAPDNFTLSVVTIARTGPAMADTFTFGAGRYAAKLTRAGADGYLLQTVIAGADIADYANVKGQSFSVAMKAKSSIASHVRITVDDGVTTSSSSYHTGGGTEEHLSVTHAISLSATKLEVKAEVKNSAGDAYVGGFVFVFAPYAPSDWQALSTTRDASTTRRGLVGVVAQEFAGVKTFANPPTFRPGSVAAATPAVVSGRLTSITTSVGNVGAGEDDLMSSALTAGILAVDGQVLRINGWGNFAANANAKRVRVYFGATAIVDSAAQAFQGDWEIEAFVIRTGAATQKVKGRFLYDQDGALQTTYINTTTAAETLANSITVKITGEATNNDDVVNEAMILEVVG